MEKYFEQQRQDLIIQLKIKEDLEIEKTKTVSLLSIVKFTSLIFSVNSTIELIVLMKKPF